MEKTLLATAVLGSVTLNAQAQSSVTLYGLIDAGITYTNSQLTSQGGRSNVQIRRRRRWKAAAGACAERRI